MPRKRPPVLTNPEKPLSIEGDDIQLFRKITPKMVMNQYIKINPPPKPIQFKHEKTILSDLGHSITTHIFNTSATVNELELLREKARGLLVEPNVTPKLLQQLFEEKKFPNGMKAVCYSCGQDLFFMDQFFIHAAHIHGFQLYETVDKFVKLIDLIEQRKQGSV